MSAGHEFQCRRWLPSNPLWPLTILEPIFILSAEVLNLSLICNYNSHILTHAHRQKTPLQLQVILDALFNHFNRRFQQQSITWPLITLIPLGSIENCIQFWGFSLPTLLSSKDRLGGDKGNLAEEIKGNLVLRLWLWAAQVPEKIRSGSTNTEWKEIVITSR